MTFASRYESTEGSTFCIVLHIFLPPTFDVRSRNARPQRLQTEDEVLIMAFDDNNRVLSQGNSDENEFKRIIRRCLYSLNKARKLFGKQ